MKFDIDSARQRGYSDEEIVEYLNSRSGRKFDVQSAIKSGHKISDIANYLASESYNKDMPPALRYRPPETTLSKVGSAFSTYGKPMLELGGMTAGGTLGAAFGGPLGAAVMGGTGYALGKKSSEAIETWIDRLEGIKQQGRPIKDEMLQALYDVKNGAVMEMGGRVAGKAITGIAGKLAGPYAKRLTEANKYAAEQAKSSGITLTPADITQSKTQGLVESLFEKAPGATDVMRDFRLQKQIKPMTDRLIELRRTGAGQESIENTGKKIWEEITDYLSNDKLLKGDQLNRLRNDIIASIGTEESLYGVGLEAKEILMARSSISNIRKNAMYEEVGKKVPNSFYPKNLQDTAKKLLSERSELAKGTQDKTMMNHLKWASQKVNISPDLAKSLSSLPPEVQKSVLSDMADDIVVKRDWQTMQLFSQEMEALISEDNPLRYVAPNMKYAMSPKGRVYNELKKAAQRDMEDAARKAGSEAWETLQQANAFYGEQARVFKNKTIQKMANINPEKLVDTAFTPNGISEIRIVKEALGEGGFNEIRKGFTNKLLGVGQSDVFDPNILRRNIIKYGDDVLIETYGRNGLAELKDIVRNGLDLTRKRPGDAFIKSISMEYPQTIVDRIIGAPESKLASNTLKRNIGVIKQAIGKGRVDELGDQLFEKLIMLHQDTGNVQPIKFAAIVDKYGENVLKEFFSYDKIQSLKSLANIARRLDSAEKIAGNPSGTGQTLVTWNVARLLLTNPVVGAAIAVGPKQLTKLYMSKFGIKWLTEGFKIPARSAKGIEYFTKLSAIIALNSKGNGENDQ